MGHSTHWHRLHSTSLHAALSASLASSSSHLIATSLTLELLIISTTILAWHSSTWWELLALEWLLSLTTHSHTTNSLDDVVQNLVNFSVFLGFLLLLNFFLGEPQFNLKRSWTEYCTVVKLPDGWLSITDLLEENESVLILRHILVVDLLESLVNLHRNNLSSFWEGFPELFFSNIIRNELNVNVWVKGLW